MSDHPILEALSTRRGYAGPTGAQTHFREAGSGPATLVIHGTGFDSSFWMRALPILSGGRRVIAADLPGYGLSDRPPQTGVPLTYYGDRMIALMDELGIDRFEIVGFHTGASVAIDIAACHPDRVTALVLAGLLALPTQSERDLWHEERIAPYEPTDHDPNGAAEHLRSQTTRWKTFSSETDPERYRAMLVARVLAAPPQFSTYLALRDFDAFAAIERIDRPTLVIHFDRDVIPLDAARRAHEHFPSAGFQLLSGESHSLLSDPEPGCAAILGFLDAPTPATAGTP